MEMPHPGWDDFRGSASEVVHENHHEHDKAAQRIDGRKTRHRRRRSFRFRGHWKRACRKTTAWQLGSADLEKMPKSCFPKLHVGFVTVAIYRSKPRDRLDGRPTNMLAQCPWDCTYMRHPVGIAAIDRD